MTLATPEGPGNNVATLTSLNRRHTVLGQPVVGMNRPALGHSLPCAGDTASLVQEILRFTSEALQNQTRGPLVTPTTPEGPGIHMASLKGPHTVLGQPVVGMNRPALGHSLPCVGNLE